MKKAFSLFGCVALFLSLPILGYAQGVDRAKVWISDQLSGVTTPLAVVSDRLGAVQPNQYTDSNLSGGDNLVQATVARNGATTFYPRGSTYTASAPRSARVYFPQSINADIPVECLNNYDEARGQYYADMYRSLSGLFVTKGGSDLRFGVTCNGGASYLSFQSDGNVPVTSLDKNTRRVTNVGSGAVTFSLYKPDGNGDFILLVSNFAFPFEMTVQRVTKR